MHGWPRVAPPGTLRPRCVQPRTLSDGIQPARHHGPWWGPCCGWKRTENRAASLRLPGCCGRGAPRYPVGGPGQGRLPCPSGRRGGSQERGWGVGEWTWGSPRQARQRVGSVSRRRRMGPAHRQREGATSGSPRRRGPCGARRLGRQSTGGRGSRQSLDLVWEGLRPVGGAGGPLLPSCRNWAGTVALSRGWSPAPRLGLGVSTSPSPLSDACPSPSGDPLTAWSRGQALHTYTRGAVPLAPWISGLPGFPGPQAGSPEAYGRSHSRPPGALSTERRPGPIGR